VPIRNSKGNTFTVGGVKYMGVGKIGDFRRKSPFISETVQGRPMNGTLIGSHGAGLNGIIFDDLE